MRNLTDPFTQDERYRTMNFLQIPPRSADSWKISLLHPHIQTNVFRFRCSGCLAIQEIHLTTLVSEEQQRFNEAHKNCAAIPMNEEPKYFLEHRGHLS